MSEVVTCTLDQLGDVLVADLDRHVEGVRAKLTKVVTYVQTEMAAQAPRDRGDFAASIRPYAIEPGGDPPPSWARNSGGATAGAADVEAVMQGWKPGQEVGVYSDAPYSRKEIFQAGDMTGQTYKHTEKRSWKGVHRKGQKRRTYTKKVPHGWVDTIVLQANRLAEER